ncbi:phage tail protein [Rahnella sp. PD12R]|uniref:glycine-rich domain-containing protein n=1 Tax=Rahnella sp. PD12R TaxID=2855688 RepID=UPI001C455EA9|nr:phage tail protein [Rahnella sp. PD12R]MBV6817800.1 phage tail protein [Rahnella sp. PD12R]
MQKIGNITSTADANGEWTNGNVAAGTAPTILDAAWLNTVQRELANVVLAAGLTLDPTNDAQLLAGLKLLTGPGRLLNIQDFSASGTYTPFPGTKFIIVEVTAGGGPGGSTPATGATQVAAGAGGGAGGTAISKLLISAITSTVAVTVGVGGVANTSTTGTSGGASSFGSYLSASGGAFSANATVVTQGDNQLTYNGGGGDGTSGNMDNIRGGCGVAGFVLKYGYESGEGGRSYHCAGGPSIITLGSNTPGIAGRRGSGGSGAFAGNNASALLGGNGGAGFVRIWEYA